MYAIIGVGGKQYKVQKGDIIEVEKEVMRDGKDISLDNILMVADGKDILVGQPCLKEARVSACVLGQLKAPKVISFKYRRRKGWHRTKGHRQQLTRIEIKEIKV